MVNSITGSNTIVLEEKMLRSNMRVLTLAMCLAVLGMNTAVQPGSSPGTAEPVAAAEDVTGSGWKAFAACVTCIAAGIGIVGGGPAVIVAAASAPGSSIALGACIAACASM